VVGARIRVDQGASALTTLEPRLNVYGSEASAIFTPAVMTRPDGDLYLTLRAIDSESITLGLDTSPMVWLIWLGGLLTAGGGFWSLAARRSERRVAPERVPVDV
jgi:cytochrome c-type biogenesis protein CcmF